MTQPGGMHDLTKAGSQAAAVAANSGTVAWQDLSKIVYPIAILILGLEIVTWVHWNALLETSVWWANPKYSHGYLVPLFAASVSIRKRR